MDLIGGDNFFELEEQDLKSKKTPTYFPIEKLIAFFLQIIESSNISCKVLLNYQRSSSKNSP